MENQINQLKSCTIKDQSSSSIDLQRDVYKDCLQKQLNEIDLLSSIFCNPGEIHIDDPSVISDFNEYIDGKTNELRMQLDFSIYLILNNDKIEIRIELPHLYPSMENANILIRSSLLTKSREIYVKMKIHDYISSMDKTETYIYQVVSWLQDNLMEFLQQENNNTLNDGKQQENEIYEFERLWIWSHHLKSKTKRHEIIQQAKELNLTGFSRPGKPGIICVEGLKENTQEFWKIIKVMRWHKITIRKSENKSKPITELEKFRKFDNFKEELFTDIGDEENVKMNMSFFMKYLDIHKCSYIRKDLFGFD